MFVNIATSNDWAYCWYAETHKINFIAFAKSFIDELNPTEVEYISMRDVLAKYFASVDVQCKFDDTDPFKFEVYMPENEATFFKLKYS